MLRIMVGDVPSTTVVRAGGVTLVIRPALVDLDEGVRDALLLLTPEECCVIRAAVGVSAGPEGPVVERYAGIVPTVACSCYIPKPLRVPFDLTPCPLHADIAATLS